MFITKRDLRRTLHTETKPLQRKERERIARQQEIMLAARKVFGQRGYRNATLDEIAEKAQFGKGTLYNYFQSKEEIFQRIVESMLDEMIRLAEAAAEKGGSTREVFHRYALHIIEYYKDNDDFLQIAAREMNRIQLEDEPARVSRILDRVRAIAVVLAALLKKEIRQKHVINVDPEELAHIFVSIIHHRSMRRILEGKSVRSIDSGKEAAFITRLFFDGAAAA